MLKIFGIFLTTPVGIILTLFIACIIGIFWYSSSSNKSAEQKKQQEQRARSAMTRIDTFEDYKRATERGQIVMSGEYQKMREQHLKNFQPKHPARIRYPVKGGECPLHHLMLDNVALHNALRCARCREEFHYRRESGFRLPSPYLELTGFVEPDEWLFLRMQDKHAQLGELTEDEARANKQDFLRYFEKIWRNDLEKQQRQTARLEEERNLRQSPKQVW